MPLSVEVEQEEDGRWLAEVPAVPGAMAYGGTRIEAADRAEALALLVLADRPGHGVQFEREVAMATDFTGTTTEKVDKVVGALVELRTTVRLCLGAVGLGLPLIIGLLTFLVAQSFSTAAKVDRLSDRLDRIERPGKP